MFALVSELFRDVSPRAKLGLGVLIILALFLVWDTGLRSVEDREIENVALKTKLTALQNLQTDGDLVQRSVEAEAIWKSYQTLLLSDSTEGLNIAGLQSTVIATLSACGLEQVVASIEAAPVELNANWTAYDVAIRARDVDNVFPVCLSDLAQLDTGLVVTDLAWRRGGNLQFSLTAYSHASDPQAGQP